MTDWTIWVELAGKLLKIIADAAGGDIEDLMAELQSKPSLDEPSELKRLMDSLDGFSEGQDTEPGPKKPA